MNVEDLQAALFTWDLASEPLLTKRESDLIVDAARLVADPNLKAMDKVNYALSHNDYSEAELQSLFDAALTPGDTDE